MKIEHSRMWDSLKESKSIFRISQIHTLEKTEKYRYTNYNKLYPQSFPILFLKQKTCGPFLGKDFHQHYEQTKMLWFANNYERIHSNVKKSWPEKFLSKTSDGNSENISEKQFFLKRENCSSSEMALLDKEAIHCPRDGTNLNSLWPVH